MIKNKKILLVAFYFYPCSLIGAKRSSYLANFLSNKGMDVTILKADDVNYYNDIDYDLSLDSNIKIINVNNIIKLKSFKQSIIWYFSFKKEIKKLLKNNDFDLIYFSGGPFFYFPLGNYFFRKFGIDNVLDFRDLWVIGSIRDLNWKGKIIHCFNKYFEKKSIRKAKIVIGVSEKITEMYQYYFGKKNKIKFITILNGFIDTDLPETNDYNLENKGVFKFGIFGKFSTYNKSNVDLLVNALECLSTGFHLFHIGEEEQYFYDKAKNSIIRENISFLGYMNYTKALSILYNFDCLILNNRLEIGLGTKIFDYIYLNKPIIAFLNKKSEQAIFLMRFSNVFFIENQNDFIKAVYMIKNKNLRTLDDNFNKYKFSRRYQMEHLYSQLQSCIHSKKY